MNYKMEMGIKIQSDKGYIHRITNSALAYIILVTFTSFQRIADSGL